MYEKSTRRHHVYCRYLLNIKADNVIILNTLTGICNIMLFYKNVCAVIHEGPLSRKHRSIRYKNKSLNVRNLLLDDIY